MYDVYIMLLFSVILSVSHVLRAKSVKRLFAYLPWSEKYYYDTDFNHTAQP